MKEIRGIITEYDQARLENNNLALATVYEVKGSSYRRSGARMLIRDDGNWFGGISGGCIEGNALKRAQLVMADNKARLVTYDTSNDDEASIGVSLGCNGVISVVIAPLSTEESLHPIENLRALVNSRQPNVLITVLESKNSSLPAGAVINSLRLNELMLSTKLVQNLQDEFKNVLESGKSKVISLDEYKLFLELIEPEVNMVVMGGNYDILPVLQMADNLGWHKTVVTNPQRIYPPAKQLADAVFDNLDDVKIDSYAVGLIMSHDYKVDLENLKKTLSTELQYIGLLGPAVRRQDMLQELRASGLEVNEERIYGPAGLDIGARQPEEIAVAIVAEIIAVRRQRTAKSLRERQLPIHDRARDSKAEVI